VSLSIKNTKYSNLKLLRAEFLLSFMFLKKYKPQIDADELRSLYWAPAFIGFYAWLIDSNVITGIQRKVEV